MFIQTHTLLFGSSIQVQVHDIKQLLNDFKPWMRKKKQRNKPENNRKKKTNKSINISLGIICALN